MLDGLSSLVQQEPRPAGRRRRRRPAPVDAGDDPRVRGGAARRRSDLRDAARAGARRVLRRLDAAPLREADRRRARRRVGADGRRTSRTCRRAWRYWVAEGDFEELGKLTDGLWLLYNARGWYHETATLITDLLDVLSSTPSNEERLLQQILLQTSLARVLMASEGYTPETERAYRARAGALRGAGRVPAAPPGPARALDLLHLPGGVREVHADRRAAPRPRRTLRRRAGARRGPSARRRQRGHARPPPTRDRPPRAGHRRVRRRAAEGRALRDRQRPRRGVSRRRRDAAVDEGLPRPGPRAGLRSGAARRAAAPSAEHRLRALPHRPDPHVAP